MTKPFAIRTDTSDLTAKLTQLHKLLSVTDGELRRSFEALNHNSRADYIFQCALLARECRDIAADLDKALHISTGAAPK